MLKKPHEYTSAERLLIILAVMSVTIMEVLDGTIVNVALPHMQGALHATSDQISWTATAYIVASGMFMPVTGYFSDVFGRKNYLLFCIVGFTIASMLCGLSSNITEIVLFRLAQGAFGAALVPLSQAIMTDIHTLEERGKAMAIWGIGVMVGPILGPTLGGYITEYYNWRMIFYVNVPIGSIAFILCNLVVPLSPKTKRTLDWLSLIFLFISIGSLQYLLDRGNELGWFDSLEIQLSCAVSIISFIAFLIHNWIGVDHPLFNLAIFKDKNFTLSTLILAIMGLGLYGSMIIHPIMLETMLGYPVMLAGLVIMPRALSGMVSMAVVSKLINKVDSRILISAGFGFNIVGLHLAMTSFSTHIDTFWAILPFAIQGLGMGLVFIPLSSMAFSTLRKELITEATGIFSLIRTIGSSVGISISITIFTRQGQKSLYHLNNFLTPFNHNAVEYAHRLGGSLSNPAIIGIMEKNIAQQAEMIAVLDTYKFMVFAFLIMLPVIWMLKNIKLTGDVPAGH